MTLDEFTAAHNIAAGQVRWIAGGARHPGTGMPSNVTGDCPHLHRTPDAARSCIERTDRAIKRGNGPNAYADRLVLITDRHGNHAVPYDE